MDLVFSRLDDSVARFTISGATPAFANALRRSMIGEVPTLAIEDVRIYDNTSVLFDEILAHRLGMVPIKTDLSQFVRRSECSCEGVGCPQCTITFTMSKEGPGMLTSGDLISMDPRTVPVHNNVPIVKLWENQKVVLEAVAELNTGSEHAKWQPTLACGYKEFPMITIHDTCDGCKKCVDECPRDVLEISENKVRVRVVNGESKEKDCSMCRLCQTACMNSGIGENPAITIGADSTKFVFVVESDGSLPVKEIIERALLHIKSRSTDLTDALQDISTEGL
ncbi:DNA-directed RNA polymerase subunit D [Methanorbis rubei]|uniref:DNA-directed RNA polymerase subunit Rpo3 n=1 Tax=Methanorbis rubei TaxID=3028300 RepID=A0AAE4MEM2_9EURY|nr:Photosystem I iron-sulfur center [Methanocorpusculaceae archaeon Cs1]